MFGKAIAATAALCGLAACTQVPDLSGIDAERKRPVHRYDITQALAANGEVIVAGTQSGAVLASADGGKSWQRQSLGSASLIGLAACPDGSFVAIDFYHKVWHADARGAGWKSVALDKPRTPLALTCDGRGRWWVAGSGATLAVSGDRGASWKVTDLGEDAQLTTLQFIDEKNAVATGEFGMVVTSSDGGTSWIKQGKIPNDFYPYAALFINRNEGWASGIAGQILHTIDSGRTWLKQDNAAQAPLYRLFLHQGRPYGVGAGGLVARLEGDTWRQMPYPDAAPIFLAAGASLDKDQAIVIGGPGGLLRVIGTQAK